MLRRIFKSSSTLTATVFVLICAFIPVSAQITITVNNVGYEKTGTKRAIVQSASAISATSAELVNAQGEVVRANVPLGAQATVASWSGDGFRYFKVADFSSFDTDGTGYRLRVGTGASAVRSPPFAIGPKLLQSRTGADQIGFFKGMRHDGTRPVDGGDDRALPIFGSSRTHDIHGGWWDATGDRGKHLSHLSYSNYYNPQQIPMVVWALLHANSAQPGAFGTATLEEAAWGADYLLRSIAPEGFFYMSVFDNWGDGYQHAGQPSGSRAPREICAWGTPRDQDGMTHNPVDGTWNSDGIRSAAYQSGMRQGAGVSIASLARAAKVFDTSRVSGAFTAAQYLDGAKRAYAHLTHPDTLTRYLDDGRLNIIDYYCALLAATELYNATEGADRANYLAEARGWLDSLLSLQSADGWFRSGKDAYGSDRPFYHAAEEGLPVVAISRFYQVAASNAEKLLLREAVRKNLSHYVNITYKDSNPFEYAKMYRRRSEPLLGGGGGNDVGGAYSITIQAEEYTSRVGDFRVENGAIGWIEDGHSATYEFNADHADSYRLEFFVATGNESSSFDVLVNGTAAGTVSFGNTNGWQNFRIEALGGSGVQLRLGPNTVRLEFKNAVNVDYFRFVSNNVVIAPPSQINAEFFIPKVNETGYWWQGENARLASMASAFILGAPIADHTGGMWEDTLFGAATAQLDWILGRNPFNLNMMYGFNIPEETNTYPHYTAAGNHLANIRGGICNGISSMRSNENNIEWMPYRDRGEGDENWRNWRFVEQWLPHNAWYLIAVSSLSYRMDNPIEPEDVSVRHSSASRQMRLKIRASRGGNIRIELPFAADRQTEVAVYNMQGRRVAAQKVRQGSRTASLKLPNVARGMYVVSIRDESGKNRVSDRVHLK